MTKQDDELKADHYNCEAMKIASMPDGNTTIKDVHDAIEALIKEQVRLGKIEENDYHWHRQKNITEHAVNGVVSTYFLGRKAQLEQEGK